MQPSALAKVVEAHHSTTNLSQSSPIPPIPPPLPQTLQASDSNLHSPSKLSQDLVKILEKKNIAQPGGYGPPGHGTIRKIKFPVEKEQKEKEQKEHKEKEHKEKEHKEKEHTEKDASKEFSFGKLFKGIGKD